MAVDVQLATVERIEAILRAAPGPVSRYYVHQRLRELGAGTTTQRLNRALVYLEAHGMVVDGSRGVQWTRSASPSLEHARLTGRHL